MTQFQPAVSAAKTSFHHPRLSRRARFERQWRQKRRTLAVVGGLIAFAAGVLWPTGAPSSRRVPVRAAKTMAHASALIAARPVEKP